MNIRYLLLAVGIAYCTAAGPVSAASNFIFTSFSNSSQTGLYVYQSGDAEYFGQYAANTYTPPNGDLCRDPSMMHYSDGKYYIAYTTGWTSSYFGIATSTDLKTWTFLTDVHIPASLIANPAECWAPVWFIDPANGSVNIIVSSSSVYDSGMTPYLFTATNSSMTSWTGGQLLSGIGPNYIDTTIIKVNGVYHAFTKNETTKYIETATSANLAGPYSFVGTGNWAGWGANVEGPSLVQLDNGNWRIYMDGYNAGQYYSSDSSNLVNWSAPTQLPWGLSGFVRHGTVWRDPIQPGYNFCADENGTCSVPSTSTVAYGENNSFTYKYQVNGSIACSNTGFGTDPDPGVVKTCYYISSSLLKPNGSYRIMNRNSGDYMDVYNKSTNWGASVIQWVGNGQSNQLWNLTNVVGNTVTLTNQNSGLLLDAYGGYSTFGDGMIQWGANGGANQQWLLTPTGGGYFTLENGQSHLMLDVSGETNGLGNQLDQWPANGSYSQEWTFQ